jgi:hypothetical protein
MPSALQLRRPLFFRPQSTTQSARMLAPMSTLPHPLLTSRRLLTLMCLSLLQLLLRPRRSLMYRRPLIFMLPLLHHQMFRFHRQLLMPIPAQFTTQLDTLPALRTPQLPALVTQPAPAPLLQFIITAISALLYLIPYQLTTGTLRSQSMVPMQRALLAPPQAPRVPHTHLDTL